MRLFFLGIAMMAMAGAAAAEEVDCAGEIRRHVAEPLAVVRSMADYKAAIEAGVAACKVSYPDEFAAVDGIGAFLRENMARELAQGIEVVGRLVAAPEDQELSQQCGPEQGGHEDLAEELKGQIDGQYEKAYARRHRIMSKAGLVESGQDSCMIVLDIIRKYDEHYKTRKELEFVLFEAAKNQGKAGGGIGGGAYRKFARIRDSLPDAEVQAEEVQAAEVPAAP